VKPSQTSAFLSPSTVEKEYVVHWGTLKFALLLFTTWSSTLKKALVVHNTHFFQDHWELETPTCGLATAGECLYTSYDISLKKHYVEIIKVIGVARGDIPPKFLENIVILCFERRFSKQNSVIRLKSNIVSPPMFWPPTKFWAGYATDQSEQLGYRKFLSYINKCAYK